MTDQDEAEFRHFVAGSGPGLLRTARLLAGEAGEDLLQDALARLVPHWARVEDPEAYVRTSLHRLAISRWRRRRFVPISYDPPDGGQEPPGTGAVSGWPGGASRRPDAAASLDRIVLGAALARLTPRQRSVLLCRHVEDLSEADTAARLGISVGTVRSTNHRALARLRDLAPELAEFRAARTGAAPPAPAPALPPRDRAGSPLASAPTTSPSSPLRPTPEAAP